MLRYVNQVCIPYTSNLYNKSFIMNGIIREKENDRLKNWLYTLYALVLGIVSFITHEVVTFVMLGFILISLNNIHSTLKEILKTSQNKLG